MGKRNNVNHGGFYTSRSRRKQAVRNSVKFKIFQGATRDDMKDFLKPYL